MSSESQVEELEVLRSIYEGDENFKEINLQTFQYKYGEDGSLHSFVLEINWPNSYPDSFPNINLDAFYNKHINNSVKEEVKSRLMKEIEDSIGCAMTYTIIEWVKEHFDELLINQPLQNVEIPTKQLSDFNLSEKQAALGNKDGKDRPAVLTKAQKRRQWDRMDGKGEKLRGYDWIDVIKHLSQTGGSNPT